MKETWFYLTLITSLLCFGCKTIPTNTVTQVSTIKTIKSKKIDKVVSAEELASYGNMGVAIKEGLKGEIFLNNGRMYEIGKEFIAEPAFSFTGIAYAAVVNFNWDTQLHISGRKKSTEIDALINKTVPNNDVLCAIRITGKFLSVKLSTINSAASNEMIEYQDVSGTMVGFRFPKYMGAICPTDISFVFLADNMKNGGDVVDFVIQEGTIDIDLCNKLNIITACKVPAN